MKSMGATQEEYYRGARMVPYDLVKELAIAKSHSEEKIMEELRGIFAN